MALYIPHSIFHLGRLLYVRPETFRPYYGADCQTLNAKLRDLCTILYIQMGPLDHFVASTVLSPPLTR